MQDDEPTRTPDPELARALEAWPPLAPPADFADRVLAAREAPAPARPRRARLIGGLAAAIAAAAAVLVMVRPSHRATSGTLVATQRTTARLGDRGIAVAEPATDLTWRVDDRGAAELVQCTGNVFYRVERGEPFAVHTPAGDVRVTGTCFRIEVEPMTPHQKLLLAGVAGAAVATTVLVTVYEGHVIAETRSAKTELAAGTTATLGGDGGATIVAGATLATPTDDAHATREQLLARARQQEIQLSTLRARLARLETTAGAAADGPDAPEPGRAWHDPSPEKLAAWVAECRVCSDEPSLDRFAPITEPDLERGVEAGEVDGYNAGLGEVAKQWKDLVHGLYLETTADTAGADALSVTAMRREIEDKSPRGEHNLVLQRLARERAGLAAPPADPSKTSPLERLMRAYVQLGDQSEASIARRLGAQRAHAIRGDGWGSRTENSGCPHPSGG
jgi:hypothetical protein